MTRRRIVAVTLGSTTGMKQVQTGVNYATNPRAVTANGWGFSVGTGGAFSSSLLSTGGPLAAAPTFRRMTLTTAPTAGSQTATFGGTGFTDIDAADIGKTFGFRMYVRSSKAISAAAGVSIGWYNGASFISGSTGTGATIAVPANTWTQLPEVLSVAPATATRANLTATVPTANISGIAAGDTLDVSAILLYKTIAGLTVPYFDGDVAGASWAGTAHASRSSFIVGIA